jgi:hypothetical protein
MRTGILNFQEAREALEQLYESSDEKRRFILRLYVLYAYNDMYGRSGVIPLDASEDQLFFEENCREMIKMERTIPTLRAELYREIGEFDKCIEYLDSLEPASEHENKVRDLIKERALIGDRTVFRL